MKQLFVVIFILFAVNSFSQTIKEKKIVSIPVDTVESYYDFSYDSENGTYVKMSYNSVTDKYFLSSNKGKSSEYNYFEFYSLVFDKKGNYYVVAQTYNSESDSKYFFLKNGKEIAAYDFINGNISVDDDYIYFSATNGEKSFVGKYNFRKEKFEYYKNYDYINFCAYDKETVGEPVFTFGFNGSGKLYYIAGLDGKEFMVIDDKNQKNFASIDSYNVTLDLKGDVCYIGTDENGSYSVIQDDKEYPKFKNIHGPIKFDNRNIPVYAASDDDTVLNPGMIVRGNEKSKTVFQGGILDFAVSPSGKIALVVAESAETDSKSFVVYQGKEGKKYDYIYNLMLDADDKLVYSGSEKEISSLVVDNKETGTKYSSIYYITISPDKKVCYIGQNYKVLPDSSRSEENYYVFGNKVLGPYYDYSYEYEINYNNIVFDKSGAYAFIASDVPGHDTDTFSYKVFTDKWSSDAFNIIQSLRIFEKNVYYLAITDDNQTYAFYKNKKKITTDYKMVLNLNYDDDGNVTFIGYKDNSYYYVTIEL